MDSLDLSRLQFATTSIYHFLFVPITIGLALLVAILHTRWYRTGDTDLRRLTRFFGTLMLINIAIGVVTGLVQEFQFGMNWSAYARFVGDVFGAPLAMEGLLAFFLESTFLGLWVFGWRVLPPRVHLLSAWLVAFGAMLSAMFIIAANSWMQHPVGYTTNPTTGRPQLDDIGAVFTNPVFIWSYAHVIAASLVAGSIIMLGVSAWHLRRGSHVALFHRSAFLAIVVLVPASMLALMAGSNLGIMEARYQPMKIAAAEAQWETCQPCSFSVAQIGGWTPDDPVTKIIEIPNLLSILATGKPGGEVEGMNPLQQQATEQFGAGTWYPNVIVQYWSMRTMAYLGTLVFLLSLWGAFLLWRRKLDTSRFFLRVATWAMVAPFLINTAGWMLAENGRQPWIVQDLMTTADGLSPSVSTTMVVLSLVVFVLLYAALGAVDGFLMVRYGRRGLELEPDDDLDDDAPGARTSALTY